jgi:hypothetical protein
MPGAHHRTTEVTFQGPQFDDSDPGYLGKRLKKVF